MFFREKVKKFSKSWENKLFFIFLQNASKAMNFIPLDRLNLCLSRGIIAVTIGALRAKWDRFNSNPRPFTV